MLYSQSPFVPSLVPNHVTKTHRGKKIKIVKVMKAEKREGHHEVPDVKILKVIAPIAQD